MKQVLQFQLSDRYEKGPETLAIVNAKFQALEVLDLLLTYQRNSRLQSFVGKFKVAEQSVALRKPTSALTPLLYDTFNPHNQTKAALRKQRLVNKEMRDMFNLSAIFDIDLLTKILTDLSKYKYDKVITKSLNILNKVYSSKTNMFNLSFKAQAFYKKRFRSAHVKSQVKSHKSRVTSPELRIPSQDFQVTKFQVSCPKSKVTSPKSQVQSHEYQVTSPKSQVQSHESQVPSLKSQVTSPKSQVPSHESQVPSLKSQVTSIKSRVSSYESQVTSLKSQVTSIKSRVSSYESQVTSLKSQVTSRLETRDLRLGTWDS
uniref:Uncharacterized protein n=1 Tax=Biomphalaria glabrata TaxID=6526 RepID=A0A2C9LFM3_BIOGL